ncbi:MAG: hypothetical protein WAW15_01885 [Minisyncoccales bacterium]
MKNSTILIIVGIAIVVIGGIVFMNTAQVEDNKSTTSTTSGIERTSKILENDLQQRTSRAVIPSIPTPMIIIVFGIVVLAAGVYDARRTPSIEKKPPG